MKNKKEKFKTLKLKIEINSDEDLLYLWHLFTINKEDIIETLKNHSGIKTKLRVPNEINSNPLFDMINKIFRNRTHYFKEKL